MSDSKDTEVLLENHEQTGLLLPVATSLLLGLIALRCFVASTFDPAFEVDPLVDPLHWFGIGPGQGALLSVLSLVVSSIILLESRLSGRGIDRLLLLFASVPLIPILLHGTLSAADMSRGLDWFAAAIAAVSIAHAVRAPGMRSLVLSTLLGILAVLCAHGFVQIFIEHPMTVKYFQINQEDVLASFGWAPDSEQARLYTRRLLQPEATGWFGLANLVSGLLAFGTVLILSSVVRARGISGGLRVFLLVIVVGLFGWILVINGSKGALGALVIGLVITSLSVLTPQRSGRTGFTGMGWLALAGVVIPAGVIFFRGAILGEASLGGEKSLLFRWHYVIGALRMFFTEPYFGVGPDGFQSAILSLKNAFNPEDPTSAHNVILDWFSTLGLFAFGWVFLLGLLTIRVGKVKLLSMAHPSKVWILFVAALCAAFWIGQVVGPAENDPLFWVLSGLGLFLGVFVLIGSNVVFERLNEADTRWCFAGAAAALLAMSMLDMIFFNGGSVGFCWAAFAAMSTTCSARRRATDYVMASTPFLYAAAFIFLAVLPLMRMDHRMESIAAKLRPYAVLKNEFQYAPLQLTPRSRLEAMNLVLESSSSFVDPDSLSLEEIADLAPGSNDSFAIASDLVRGRAPFARRAAVNALVTAWDTRPEDLRPAWASIDQLRLLATEARGNVGRAALLEAITRSESMLGGPDGVRAAIVTAWTSQQLALFSGDVDWAIVARDFERAIEVSPYDPRLHLGLADAAREMGDGALESSALSDALLTDDRKYHDPLVQFSKIRRAQLEARLERILQSSS
jgi:hypothetical protein